MSSLLIFLGCILILTTLHELAHVLCAKCLGKDITQIGFSSRPFPHVYVTIKGHLKKCQRVLYMISGILAVVIVAIIVLPFSLAPYIVKLGVVTQILIDTNPFFSDVSLVILEAQAPGLEHSLKDLANRYYYSWTWYVHVVIWSVFIVLIVKKVIVL